MRALPRWPRGLHTSWCSPRRACALTWWARESTRRLCTRTSASAMHHASSRTLGSKPRAVPPSRCGACACATRAAYSVAGCLLVTSLDVGNALRPHDDLAVVKANPTLAGLSRAPTDSLLFAAFHPLVAAGAKIAPTACTGDLFWQQQPRDWAPSCKWIACLELFLIGVFWNLAVATPSPEFTDRLGLVTLFLSQSLGQKGVRCGRLPRAVCTLCCCCNTAL